MSEIELESAYLALCDTVQSQTIQMVEYMDAGRFQEAGEAAAQLDKAVKAAREQFLQRQDTNRDTYQVQANWIHHNSTGTE